MPTSSPNFYKTKPKKFVGDGFPVPPDFLKRFSVLCGPENPAPTTTSYYVSGCRSGLKTIAQQNQRFTAGRRGRRPLQMPKMIFYRARCRYSLGERPMYFRKIRLKYRAFSYPQKAAISPIFKEEEESSSRAWLKRILVKYR